MKQTVKILLAVLSVGAMMQTAQAQNGRRGGREQRLVLPMFDQVYQGRNQIIGLRRAIKQEYRRVNLQQMNLISVRVVGKSKHGRGNVKLLIDGYEQDSSRLYGTPEEFRSSRPHTYDRVNLAGPRRNSAGKWQLSLNGNIKLKRIVVMVKQKRGGGGGGRSEVIDLGTMKPNKVLGSGESFRAGYDDVTAIVLIGENKRVNVESVKVVYGNGTSEYLYGLEGSIREGREKSAHINGRHVKRVIVSATSPGLFGNRGRLRVQLEKQSYGGGGRGGNGGGGNGGGRGGRR